MPVDSCRPFGERSVSGQRITRANRRSGTTLDLMVEFVRWQSAVPNRNGHDPGVFALANGLRHSGLLNDGDAAWHKEANRRASAAYIDPTTVDFRC